MRASLPTPTTPVWAIVSFFELELPSGPIYLTTAIVDLTFNGKVYKAIGRLGKITNMKEGLNLLIGSMDVTMFSIPLELYPEIASERFRNKPAVVLIGLWENGIVGSPVPVVKGKVTQINIVPSAEMSITLTVTSDLATIKKAASSRYTDAEQRVKFPGDRGLEFVNNLKNLNLNWGG